MKHFRFREGRIWESASAKLDIRTDVGCAFELDLTGVTVTYDHTEGCPLRIRAKSFSVAGDAEGAFLGRLRSNIYSSVVTISGLGHPDLDKVRTESAGILHRVNGWPEAGLLIQVASYRIIGYLPHTTTYAPLPASKVIGNWLADCAKCLGGFMGTGWRDGSPR